MPELPLHLTPLSRQFLLAAAGIAVAALIVALVRRRRLRSASIARPAKPPVARRARSTAEALAPFAQSEQVAIEAKSIPAATAATASRRQHVAASVDAGANPIADDSDLVFGPLTPALAELLPESETRKRDLARSLQNAGHYSANAWRNLAAIRTLGIVLPILGCLAALVLAPPQFEPVLMAGLIILPLVGWALPTLLIRSRAKARLNEMSHAMPDLLDLLNMCVSQGMTAPAALSRVASELQPVYPALAKELKIVTEQARIGSLEQALRGLSSRVDTPEIHSFTSLLIQTEQMGTSVSEALAEHSDSMREGFRQRADEAANAATFKMLFPTVLCLMPAVFMFLLGPAMIELNDFFFGRGQEVLNSNTAAVELLNREPR
ncbi:MAG: type II secretion system F family protein [Planctomyces sp.]|nr:type II secretion system F family protein [Planctomyces sp.]